VEDDALAELRDTESRYMKVHPRPIFSRIKLALKDLGESFLSTISMILHIHLQLMRCLQNKA
jgi:hypothetical protein